MGQSEEQRRESSAFRKKHIVKNQFKEQKWKRDTSNQFLLFSIDEERENAYNKTNHHETEEKNKWYRSI